MTAVTETPGERATETGLWRDVNDIRHTVERYLAGGVSDDEFRHFRVLRGLYSQRQPGVHMVRVRVPLGRLLSLIHI